MPWIGHLLQARGRRLQSLGCPGDACHVFGLEEQVTSDPAVDRLGDIDADGT